MINVVCPKCQKQTLMQNAANPKIFTCSTCGEFMLLPAKPGSKDVSTVWDYLIRAGKHLKELERTDKI